MVWKLQGQPRQRCHRERQAYGRSNPATGRSFQHLPTSWTLYWARLRPPWAQKRPSKSLLRPLLANPQIHESIAEDPSTGAADRVNQSIVELERGKATDLIGSKEREAGGYKNHEAKQSGFRRQEATGQLEATQNVTMHLICSYVDSKVGPSLHPIILQVCERCEVRGGKLSGLHVSATERQRGPSRTHGSIRAARARGGKLSGLF